MTKLDNAIHNIKNDVESTEHEYVVRCLQAAVNYCYEQFRDNCGEIDPLPSISEIGLLNEEDKFALLDVFLKTLQP